MYKVVKSTHLGLVSPHSGSPVLYVPGEKTVAHIPQSPLFLFQDYEQAVRAANEWLGEVWSVMAEDVWYPKWIALDWTSHKALYAFWNGGGTKERPAATGTMAAMNLTLIERLYVGQRET